MAALTSCTTAGATERGRQSRRSLKQVTSELAKTARGGYSSKARGGDCTLGAEEDWGRGFMYGVVMVAPGIDRRVNFFIAVANLRRKGRGGGGGVKREGCVRREGRRGVEGARMEERRVCVRKGRGGCV